MITSKFFLRREVYMMHDKLCSSLEVLLKAPEGAHIEVCKDFPTNVDCYSDYLFFDKIKYTRNLIAENEALELMTLCWEPGQETPIHDHSGSEGLMLVLQGELDEVIYNQASEFSPVVKNFTRSLSAGQSSVITEEVGLHKIANSSSQRAVSLHLYCKPIKSFYVYNERTPKRMLKVPSFYSRFGQTEDCGFGR